VFGRVSYDLNPLQKETALEDVRTFERSVGGFAGNVATGLARLDVPCMIVSGVGDDPHGRYIRRWLVEEGVDDAGLVVHPFLRTALAFYESWPPDRFPITLFRSPTAPDWELSLDQIPEQRLKDAWGLVVSGTGLARPTSLETTLGLLKARRYNGNQERPTVIDLDWRPAAWERQRDFPTRARQAIELANVVIGGEAEFEAAALTPDEVANASNRIVVIKRGAKGSMLLHGDERVEAPGLPVPVEMGLGSGDGFLAAFVGSLFQGWAPAEALTRANVAGAIVATRPMCSPAMPTWPEIDALLGTIPPPGPSPSLGGALA
jgi:5-dehydro-2-deoxygluconokinase